ncbi:hypothetical protein A244_38500, partial [Pseudomonas syringae pv. actinidiae ICMP 18807]
MRACSRRRLFRKDAFASKLAPTAFGPNQKRTRVHRSTSGGAGFLWDLSAKRTFADKRSVARSAPTESFECTEREVSRRTLIMPHIVGASLLANAVIQAGRFREQAR